VDNILVDITVEKCHGTRRSEGFRGNISGGKASGISQRGTSAAEKGCYNRRGNGEELGSHRTKERGWRGIDGAKIKDTPSGGPNRASGGRLRVAMTDRLPADAIFLC
jgi:hypothetical protein